MNKTLVTIPTGQEITSVEMNDKEFEQVCREIYKILRHDISDWEIGKLIPIISNNNKTASIFKKYEIHTKLCSFFVRPTEHIEPTSEVQGLIEQEYVALPDDIKENIDSTADNILGLITTEQPPHSVIASFLTSHNNNLARMHKLNTVDQSIQNVSLTLISARAHYIDSKEIVRFMRGYLRRLVTTLYFLAISNEIADVSQTNKNSV